jgi:hypothetical protein
MSALPTPEKKDKAIPMNKSRFFDGCSRCGTIEKDYPILIECPSNRTESAKAELA